MPPLIFGCVNLSQESQCRDRLSRELPHQYFAMGDVIVLHTFLVNWKQHMLYVGIAWAMDLSSTSRPAQAR